MIQLGLAVMALALACGKSSVDAVVMAGIVAMVGVASAALIEHAASWADGQGLDAPVVDGRLVWWARLGLVLIPVQAILVVSMVFVD